MRQFLYIFLLFLTVNPSFCQTDTGVVQTDCSILNGHREDTIWRKVTKREGNQIYYTTYNYYTTDEWVKDFQDLCVWNYIMDGKVIHYERQNFLTSNPWQYVGNFDHGYARVWNETRGAYIDSTGKCESDCPFDDMGKFRYGY